jgi:drug/metabolite transporter (DMT)-like permease
MLLVAGRRPAADGQPDPVGWRQWAASAVVGSALVLGGNGLVSVAERHVASGISAVVIATVPIWAALIAAVAGIERIGRRQTAGLLLGFAGVATLLAGSGGQHADVVGLLVLVAAALSWAGGSVWSRTAPLPRRPLVMTGLQMFSGGLAALVAAAASGEVGQLSLSRVPAQAWVGLAYLVTFGSILAYTAYVWLLANAPLSRATSYAYVNPLVAVLLGVAFLHERFGLRAALATAVIVAGVALIVAPARNAAPPALREHVPPLDDEVALR